MNSIVWRIACISMDYDSMTLSIERTKTSIENKRYIYLLLLKSRKYPTIIIRIYQLFSRPFPTLISVSVTNERIDFSMDPIKVYYKTDHILIINVYNMFVFFSSCSHIHKTFIGIHPSRQSCCAT